MAGPFKTKCPHCGDSIVVMSPINASVPMATPPSYGDAIRCDRCTNLSVVRSVDGDRVFVMRLDLEPDNPRGNAQRVRRALS